MRLLFICSQNKWRSLTAERLFDNHPHHEARSAGTEPGARVCVTAGHLGWAEIIFVMECRHADRLRAKFAPELRSKTIVTLRISDKYPFRDPTLMALPREKLERFPERCTCQASGFFAVRPVAGRTTSGRAAFSPPARPKQPVHRPGNCCNDAFTTTLAAALTTIYAATTFTLAGRRAVLHFPSPGPGF